MTLITPKKRLTRSIPAVVVACLLTGAGAAAAAASVPEYVETAHYHYEPDAATGFATVAAHDTIAFTAIHGSSVSVVTLDAAGAPMGEPETLTAPEARKGFGTALALSADATQLYVSQPRSSQIHEFSRGASGWTLSRTLTAPQSVPRVDPHARSNVGEVLAVSGHRLIVGAPNATIDGKAHAGFAYAVDLRTEEWTPLIPESPIGDSITGSQVAIHNNLVAIGAPQNRNSHDEQIGGVYLWDLDAGTPPAFTTAPGADDKVCLPRSGGGPSFGMSLAFTAAGLAVSSPTERNYTGPNADDEAAGCTDAAFAAGATTQGAVYIFDETLTQRGPKLVPPAHTLQFGSSIGAEGNVLVTNAMRASGGERAGEALVYDTAQLDLLGEGDAQHRQRPTPQQVLRPGADQANPEFGTGPFGSVTSVSARAIVVGTNSYEGAVNVFGVGSHDAALRLEVPGASVTYGQPSSLTAHVSAGAAPEHAVVQFAVDGTVVGERALHEGVATLDLAQASYPVGDYTVAATAFDGAHDPLGETATGTLTVTQARTTTTAALNGNTEAAEQSTPGQSTADTGQVITGSVTAEYGTIPTGAVAVAVGDRTLATLEIDTRGNFTWQAPTSSSAERYSFAYAGDVNHAASHTKVEIPATDPGTIGPHTPGGKPAQQQLPTAGALPPAALAVVGTLLGIAGALFIGARRLRQR